MALGIHKDGIFTVYSIPLIGGNDKEWKDNTWIVEHLRHLADKIEETKMEIYTIGIESTAQYKLPTLVIKQIGDK